MHWEQDAEFSEVYKVAFARPRKWSEVTRYYVLKANCS